MDTTSFIEAILAMLVSFYFSLRSMYVLKLKRQAFSNWRETYAEELKELEN